jgi:hypothetical protein
LIAAIILFALFLPNRIEIDFADNFWEIRFENLFFKRTLGSKENEKSKEPPTVEATKKKEQKIKSENKEKSDLKREKEKKERISPKVSAQKEECREKEEKDNPNISKEAEEIPEFDENTQTAKDTKESLFERLEFVKEIWEREEKTVKSLLKFVVKTVKLSLKLLIPAKIDVKIYGGTGEPAETGWLYSVFILLNSFFENNRRISLDFAPDFIKAELKFDGRIKYCFSIAGMLLFLLIVLVYIPYLQIIKCIWRNRKLLTRKDS